MRSRSWSRGHRRELVLHCYRVLGSAQDAEDAVQETFLAAWQHIAGFEARSSVRSWLYRIATNRCLAALRSARRRQPAEVAVPAAPYPEPNVASELMWLEPYPDLLLEGIADATIIQQTGSTVPAAVGSAGWPGFMSARLPAASSRGLNLPDANCWPGPEAWMPAPARRCYRSARHLLYDPDLDAEAGVLEAWASAGDE